MNGWTTMTSAMKRNAYIRFRCATCGKFCIISTPLTIQGSSSRRGLSQRQSTKDQMTREARESMRTNAEKVFLELSYGIENAALHDQPIDGRCTFCNTDQDWAKSIRRIIRTKRRITYGQLASILGVTINCLVMQATKEYVINAQFFLCMASCTIFVLLKRFFPKTKVASLNRLLENMNTQDRPALIRDMTEYQEAAKLMMEEHTVNF